MTQDQSQMSFNLIREVFSYNRRFQKALFVIKIDCPLIDNPEISLLMKDIALLHQNGIQILIVPGAKESIETILKTYKIESSLKKGIRQTSKESLPFIRMAAFDISNKIMGILSSHNIHSVIGTWVRARSMGVIEGVDFQETGLPDRLEKEAINSLLKENYIPIFPCIGWSRTGTPYNLSSDDLAQFIATEMGAQKLFYISPQSSLRASNKEEAFSKLSINEALNFLEKNPNHPLKTKLQGATKACQSGVNRVHLLDGRQEGVILQEIFSNLGVGTMIFSNVYERIRPMQKRDISSVMSLMKPLIEEGVLVQRNSESFIKKLKDYVVYSMDGTVHGAVALHSYSKDMAEIAGLVVDPLFSHLKIGKMLVEFILNKAQKMELKKVFILTTQTSDWFLSLGFSIAEIHDLPLEKREQYNYKRKSRILIKEL